MAYYTAVYQKDDYNWFTKENQIFENADGFRVHDFQGRYHLIKDGYRIGVLIGEDRFQNAYNGDFEKWIDTIRKKDINKIEKLKEYQEQISKDIEIIESIWK